MPEYLTLDQVAERIGVEVTTVRRAVRRIQSESDLEILKGMVPGRARSALCVSDAHANLIAAYFEKKQGQTALQNGSPDLFASGDYGFFYLIQLVPEALPTRVKIGYTDALEIRLKEHQTSAPTARLVKSWRCKRAWDRAAMDSITKSDCALVLNEVYEGEVEKFVQRGDDFFSRMPSENQTIPLSPNSPLSEENVDAV